MSSGGLVRMLRSAWVKFRRGGLESIRETVDVFLFCKQRLHVFALDLSDGYKAPALDPGVEIRQARPEDLEQLRASAEGKRSEFYRDHVDGAEPWVALWEGWPAHIAWIYDSRLRTRFVRLRPGEAELRYGHTCQGFRALGLYGLTNAVIAAELSRRGYQRVYGVVVDHGAAFRLGLELALVRFGFRRLWTLSHVRLLGVQWRPYFSL